MVDVRVRPGLLVNAVSGPSHGLVWSLPDAYAGQWLP